MEKYENLGLVGEGSYGIVMKCRHKSTGTLVAIKKFLESEDDRIVKRIADREIKMLKQLRHDNLVTLIDVFKRRKKLFLVFEFVDYTLLDDLEKNPGGLEDKYARMILFQVLRGIEFCHNSDIIHRDVKPENILVSKTGIVKLCDFGFARPISGQSRSFTDYVATRWYRAPELLVGDTRYGKPVDVWAVGCLTAEMYTGDPLFPGDSDIDQLFHIIRCIGPICTKHVEIFKKNSLFKGLHLPQSNAINSVEKRYPKLSTDVVHFIMRCLDPSPESRPSSTSLLKFSLFPVKLANDLIADIRIKVKREQERNPLLLLQHQQQHNIRVGPHSPSLANAARTESRTSVDHSALPVKKPLPIPYKAPAKNAVGYKLRQESLLQQQTHTVVAEALSYDRGQEPPSSVSSIDQQQNGGGPDDDGWTHVAPLTARKERVASRAGRLPKKQLEEIDPETTESDKAMPSDSVVTTETAYAASPLPEKPTNNAFTHTKSTSEAKPSSDNAKTPTLEARSSPTEVSHSQLPHQSPPKKPVAPVKQMGTYSHSQLPHNPFQHPQVNLRNTTGITNKSSPIANKPSPTANISSIIPHRNIILGANNPTDPLPNQIYLPIISRESVRFRAGGNVGLASIGSPSKIPATTTPSNNSCSNNITPSNNNNNGMVVVGGNSLLKTGGPTPSFHASERTGQYYKKKPFIFQSRINPFVNYHDNLTGNISLPELKGAEMPILRSHGHNVNQKYKYLTPKTNFNSSEPQSISKHIDNCVTREP